MCTVIFFFSEIERLYYHIQIIILNSCSVLKIKIFHGLFFGVELNCHFHVKYRRQIRLSYFGLNRQMSSKESTYPPIGSEMQSCGFLKIYKEILLVWSLSNVCALTCVWHGLDHNTTAPHLLRATIRRYLWIFEVWHMLHEAVEVGSAPTPWVWWAILCFLVALHRRHLLKECYQGLPACTSVHT